MKHPIQHPPYVLKPPFKAAIFALIGSVSPLAAQNAVILGNATFNGGHADGGVFVQGNVNGSNYEVNQHNISSDALYIGGDNNISNFIRANNGVADIGGQPGSYHGQTGSITTPNWSAYGALSEQYSQSDGLAADFSNPNNVQLVLNGGLNVFSVDSSQLGQFKTLDFTGTGTVIMNVTGDLNSWGWSVNYDPGKIIWNFIDAEVVNITDRHFVGSIIAPNATVTQNQNIDGFLLAENWIVNNSVELHYYGTPELTIPNPIPEPSTAGLLVLGAFTALRRKRKY